MVCVCIPRMQLPAYWHLVGGWIARACAAGAFDQVPDDVKDRLFESDLAVLVLIRNDELVAVGCMVLDAMPEESRVHVSIVGGERHLGAGWLDVAVACAVDAARVLGCERITCGGRRGWRRVLPRYGFVFDGLGFSKGVQ